MSVRPILMAAFAVILQCLLPPVAQAALFGSDESYRCTLIADKTGQIADVRIRVNGQRSQFQTEAGAESAGRQMLESVRREPATGPLRIDMEQKLATRDGRNMPLKTPKSVLRGHGARVKENGAELLIFSEVVEVTTTQGKAVKTLRVRSVSRAYDKAVIKAQSDTYAAEPDGSFPLPYTRKPVVSFHGTCTAD